MLLAERALLGKKVAAIEELGVPIIRYMPGVVIGPANTQAAPWWPG
jgi:hypothetical protein